MNAKPRLLIQLVIAAMFMVTSVAAFAADDFPGSKPDRRILNTQTKVDELFEKGDYERAYFIYREELVPLGDKYAQYMVGYMNIVGKGVARDYIAGSAWYRLAAERGDENFTRARDEVWELFNDEQRLQSDTIYAELRLNYSDVMIIAKLIEDDLEIVESHVQLSALANELVEAQNRNNARLVADAEERIEDRLGFLRSSMSSGSPLAEAEIRRILQIEDRADSAIQ